MYLIEYSAWKAQTTARTRKRMDAALRRVMDQERAGKGKPNHAVGIHDRVSEQPSAEGSLYAFNDTYIELRAGALQEKRGIITFFSLPLMFMLWTLASLSAYSNTVWITHVHYWLKTPADISDYADAIITPLILMALCWAIYKFVWCWLRLENFVQRRLLVRCNRITRQVYLHRPRYAGGIATLAWDQVSPEPGVGRPESFGMGTQLLLAWTQDITGLPYNHLMFVGKTANGTSDVVNLWEFIRRYMEEGPASVPPPKKLLTKIPWPWLSLLAPWSFLKPLWRAGQHRLVAGMVVVLSPVLLVHAIGHWLSLLLGWEPRWPKIIRQAGLPGKPIPPLSNAAEWPPPPVAAPEPTKPGRTRKPRGPRPKVVEDSPRVRPSHDTRGR